MAQFDNAIYFPKMLPEYIYTAVTILVLHGNVITRMVLGKFI